MKKGASKKFLFGIVGALFVLGFLITPTPKNEDVSAQATCSVVSGRFTPSTIDGEIDGRFMDQWYDEKTQKDFSISVALKGCKGSFVSVKIKESDGYGEAGEFVDMGKTATDNYYTGGFVSNKIQYDDSTLIFNGKVGSSQCEAEVGPDCDLHFVVFVGAGSSLTQIYTSIADDYAITQGGKLGYDEKDKPKKSFIVISGTEEAGDKVGTIWYYKLKNGKYAAANSGSGMLSGAPMTKTDCEAEARSKQNSAAVPEECTSSPDLDDILGGTLNGMASAIPTCGITSIPACVVEVIYWLVFIPMSVLAGLAGQFFDALFDFSISSEIYGGGGSSIGFLKVAWTFVRDIANLGFIFTLLWIAIKQVTSPVKYDAKGKLPGIIIIALVINFSYFFGTVIIDVTNVLARFLYTNDAICVNTAGKCDGSISEGIVGAFNPQTMIEKGSASFQEATGETEMSVSFYAIILILSIWVSWEMFMLFFKMGTLFLGRIIQLWVHLVLSPIAFINYILPMKIGIGKNNSAGIASPQGWAQEFFKNAFIAPLFMFFLYLIFLMLTKFEFVRSSFGTHGHSSFIALITMIFPFFVIITLMKAAMSYTQSQAGNVATIITDKVNKAVGMVAGTALALGGGAILGAAVKGGGAALGKISKRMVGREGSSSVAGFNMGGLGRTINSKVAKMGGKVNKYAETLPDKNFDIRNSKISSFVKNATGFDMKEGKAGVDKVLSYGGIRPSETFNQRNERRSKEDFDDIERRKISEKTDKTDFMIRTEYIQKRAELFNEIKSEREKAQAAGKAFDEADFVKKYKTKKAGSEALFDAKNKEEHIKAAKDYNKKVEKDFVETKMRHVYGGKTEAETLANRDANRQTGAGIANLGDLAGAGAGAGGLTLAGSTIATGLGTAGIGLAGAAVLGANAASKRDSDLAFLRKYESKRADMEKEKDKADKEKKRVEKIKKDIELSEDIQINKDADFEKADAEMHSLANALKENGETIKDADGNLVESFKSMFESELAKQKLANEAKPENERSSDDILERKAISLASTKFDKTITETMSDLYKKGEATAAGPEKDALEAAWLQADEFREKFRKQDKEYVASSNDRNSKAEKASQGRDRINKLQDSIESIEDKKKRRDEEKKKKDSDAPKGGDKKEEKKDKDDGKKPALQKSDDSAADRPEDLYPSDEDDKKNNKNDDKDGDDDGTGGVPQTTPKPPVPPSPSGQNVPIVSAPTEPGIPERLRSELKSFGVSQKEIDVLNPADAWLLLQQKTLEKTVADNQAANTERAATIDKLTSEWESKKTGGISLRKGESTKPPVQPLLSDVEVQKKADDLAKLKADVKQRADQLLSFNVSDKYSNAISSVAEEKINWINSDEFTRRLKLTGADDAKIAETKNRLVENINSGKPIVLPVDKFQELKNVLAETGNTDGLKEASGMYIDKDHTSETPIRYGNSIIMPEVITPQKPPLPGEARVNTAPQKNINIATLRHEMGHMGIGGEDGANELYKNANLKTETNNPDSTYIGTPLETDARIQVLHRESGFNPQEKGVFGKQHLETLKTKLNEGKLGKDAKDMLNHYDDASLIKAANRGPAI